MLCGALAGAATVLITNPIWVVNTRMTAALSEDRGVGRDEEKGKGNNNEEEEEEGGRRRIRRVVRKPSTLSTLLALLREEGPMALFKGVVPALVLIMNPILQYTIFEQLKEWLVERRRKKGGKGITPRDVFLLGALGKLAATSITYPYITVKSRMHVAKGKEGEEGEGMAASFRRVIREEGWAGLYKGERRSVLFYFSTFSIYLI